MKLSLFLIAALHSAKGAEVYQVIYSGDELHGSNGDAVIFLNEPGTTMRLNRTISDSRHL